MEIEKAITEVKEEEKKMEHPAEVI